MTRIVSKAELAQHAKRGDCWVVVHGHVFDVSRFMEDHPGGWEILVANGKQMEDAAEEFEQIKHSKDARALSTQHLIGKLEGTTKPFPMDVALKGSMGGPVSAGDARREANMNQQGDDPSSPLLVGAIVLGLALGAYYVFQKRR